MPEVIYKIIKHEIKGKLVKIYIKQVRRKGTAIYDNYASENNKWIPLGEYINKL